MEKRDIAAALREMADWLDFSGDPKEGYRARAYRKGSDAIEAANDLDGLIASERLTELPGIGAALAAFITELSRTGRSPQLEKQRAGRPPSLLALRSATGLSPPKIRALHAAGISDVDALKVALAAGKVRDVPGFTDKSIAKLVESMQKLATRGAAVLRVDALGVAHAVREALSPLRVHTAGALRRGLETIDTIDLVVESDDASTVLDRFGEGAEVEAREASTSTIRLREGLRARLSVATPDRLGETLFTATGPDEHVAAVRARLGSQHFADELELYRAAKLPFIPPELRDDIEVLHAADAGDTFDDLLAEHDIRGLVHCHTVYSDGKNTIEEMARAAEALGYSYITITDHSPTASYAGGVEVDRLKRQWDEIAAVQESVSIRILRGTESDITKDGALDYPDAILEQLDVVVASIHNRYKLDRGQMTERIVRAMQTPVFKIWGHALGRMLLDRDPIDCDVDEIFEVIARSRAAIEVNGDPHRIDLPPPLIPRARARGIKFVVSVDAHSTAALAYLANGVIAARRGGLRKGDVLNTLPFDAFSAAVRPA